MSHLRWVGLFLPTLAACGVFDFGIRTKAHDPPARAPPVPARGSEQSGVWTVESADEKRANAIMAERCRHPEVIEITNVPVQSCEPQQLALGRHRARQHCTAETHVRLYYRCVADHDPADAG